MISPPGLRAYSTSSAGTLPHSSTVGGCSTGAVSGAALAAPLSATCGQGQVLRGASRRGVGVRCTRRAGGAPVWPLAPRSCDAPTSSSAKAMATRAARAGAARMTLVVCA